MYVTQMLNDIANQKEHRNVSLSAAPVKRNTEKAREAKKKKVRKWFQDNMKEHLWTTTQISSKRGQDNSSCLPLLYDLEQEGFLERAGKGTRVGRGKCPIIWKLAHP